MSWPRIIQDRRVGLAGWAAPRELRFITIVMRQPWTLALPSDSVGWTLDTGHLDSGQLKRNYMNNFARSFHHDLLKSPDKLDV